MNACGTCVELSDCILSVLHKMGCTVFIQASLEDLLQSAPLFFKFKLVGVVPRDTHNPTCCPLPPKQGHLGVKRGKREAQRGRRETVSLAMICHRISC